MHVLLVEYVYIDNESHHVTALVSSSVCVGEQDSSTISVGLVDFVMSNWAEVLPITS
jgi:hypothetical protein